MKPILAFFAAYEPAKKVRFYRPGTSHHRADRLWQLIVTVNHQVLLTGRENDNMLK